MWMKVDKERYWVLTASGVGAAYADLRQSHFFKMVSFCGSWCISGFLSLGSMNVLGQQILCCGAVLHIVGCLAAFLASTHR